ncbi:MAG TPA: hypothetical protein VGN23_12280 [Verrucomicrobiae bacterium]|jgi:hypothetical protein
MKRDIENSLKGFSRRWQQIARPHPDLLPQEKEQGANRLLMRSVFGEIPVNQNKGVREISSETLEIATGMVTLPDYVVHQF